MKNLRALVMCGLCVGVITTCGRAGFAADRPEVKRARATSSDVAVEPVWDEKLTITVGPEKADVVGQTDKAIQAAVDYVARLGGGTVKLLGGTYRLRNSIFLHSKIRLIGVGAATILLKEPMAAAKLAEDSDWYDQEITLEDSSGFKVGDGVCLRCQNPHTKTETVVKRTLVARSGNRFKLDRPLRENLWKVGGAKAFTLFPLVTGENIEQVAIEDLLLDGNRTQNGNLDGNYGGCIFLQDCSRVAIRRVTARNNNGDGISWQICHDVVVEDCTSRDNAQLGLHPGSGSQRPIMRRNQLLNNDIGIFFCWGVKYGLAANNQIDGNRVGISIGHRDTDNLVTGNVLAHSKELAVLFRPERGKDFAGHRNRIEKNRFVDNGKPGSVAVIDIQGETEAIDLSDNEFVELRKEGPRTAIRLGAQTREIHLGKNEFRGFAQTVERLK